MRINLWREINHNGSEIGRSTPHSRLRATQTMNFQIRLARVIFRTSPLLTKSLLIFVRVTLHKFATHRQARKPDKTQVMKLKNVAFIGLSVFFFCAKLAGQSDITVRLNQLADQLPSNSVQRVFQDREGFFWFGTLDGICRYDGYRIITFRSDAKNNKLLTNNEITSIADDDNNHLWIGTRKGMNILNKNDYSIRQINDKELHDQNINCITTTSDGYIWVGASNRVFRYNRDLKLCDNFESKLPNEGVNAIYEDLNGSIWILFWHGGMFRFNPSKNNFESFPPIGASNNPFRIFQDSRKQYWVCTWEDGLFRFDPQADNDKKYVYQEIKDKQGQVNSRLFSIVQDDFYHYIWVMSSSGLHTLKYNDMAMLEYVDLSDLFRESNSIYSEVKKDRNGNLWIGTFSEGICTINFNTKGFQNFSFPSIRQKTGLTPSITAILEDDTGDIWFNQNRYGLGVYNTKTNSIKFFRDMPHLKPIASLGIVSSVSMVNFKSIPEIWIAPTNQPAIYAVKKEKDAISLTQRIDLTKTCKNPGNPNTFFEDSKHNIWIITSNGLLMKPVKSDKIHDTGFKDEAISGITEDVLGNIWLSSRKNGVFEIKYNGKPLLSRNQITAYAETSKTFSGNNVEAICADTKGNVWIGTKEGNIIVFDTKTRKMSDKSGAFSSIDEGILNITTDNFGHIWISTNKRVIEYNPTNNAIREHTSSDGVIVNSFLSNSIFKSHSGNLYFGGNKGLTMFTPSAQLSSREKKSKPIITDIKINNTSVLQDINTQFKLITQRLTLKPNDKNIEIDFSTLDFTYSDKIQFAYKMSGVDDDWVYTAKNRQFAIYNQLKKGNHTFLVKATDENKLWNSEIIKLKIYKQAAFYETWWAYTCYALIALFLVFVVFRIIRNRLRLQNDLRIAQIEKEKSEELTQTKLQYFTNISHDFLTPLTIISCLIDDAETTSNVKLSQFESMRANINRLRRLTQQVLDFRKIESGRLKLKLSNGDIVLFLRDICNTNFAPLMKRKRINFAFTSGEASIPAYFDADKIDKIIFNLLSNASKYTPENGEIKIAINTSSKMGHEYLTVAIKDSGIGIEKEELDKIFTLFYTNKNNKNTDSNGIGLSHAYDLLKIHQGKIEVESEKNVGTTFTIEFPIDKESYDCQDALPLNSIIKDLDSGQTEIKEAMKMNLPIATDEKNRTRIMVVEDNEELLTLMRNILAKHHHIITASNGAEALSLLKDKNIDIIISDVMMPEMDGLELCRALKNDIETSHIPVILLTAKNSTEDRIECYEAGADAYISKPFELKLLEARIVNFIAQKRKKQSEFQSNSEISFTALEYPSIDEQFLKKSAEVIQSNLSNSDFDVNHFANEMNLSNSSLYRKIKSMTGLSPVEYIRNIRLKHACKLLQDNAISISEVAYTVGFSDPKYFASCFKAEFSITPSEYQKTSSR